MIELPPGLHGAFRRSALVSLLGLHVGPGSALTSHTAALIYGCTAADPTAIHVVCAVSRPLALADLRATRGQVLLELATGLPESPAESAMLLALYDAGLPLPQPQHSVRDISGRERYA